MNLVDLIKTLHIPVVNVHGRFDSAKSLLEFTRPLVGTEGFVVCWPNGHRVKVKAEKYLVIHKIKDLIGTERHIAAMILNSELDDVIPLLDVEDVEKIHRFDHEFHEALHRVLNRIDGLIEVAKNTYNFDRKKIALEFVPTLKFKEDARFVFLAADGKDVHEAVMHKLKSDVNNTTKFESMKAWMEWL
jgi:hypothetical protein